MIRREFSQLAVYSIDQEMETLPLECLRKLFLEKTSDIIYIIREKKLYGIICMKEAMHGHKGNLLIKINKLFTALKGGEYEAIEAYIILAEKSGINKIPVVNEAGELLRDYSRWDDVLYIERNWKQLMKKEIVKKILNSYEVVYIVETAEEEFSQYIKIKEILDCFEIRYEVLPKGQICKKLEEKAICIFENEDERRGIQCLYGLEPRLYDSRGYNTFRWDYLAQKKWKLRMATYKSLLIQLKKEIRLSKVGIKKPKYLMYDRLDEKTTILTR